MVRSVKTQSEITNIAMMFKSMIEERLNKSEEELAQDHDLRVREIARGNAVIENKKLPRNIIDEEETTNNLK